MGANDDLDGKTTHFDWFFYTNDKGTKISKTSHSGAYHFGLKKHFLNIFFLILTHTYVSITSMYASNLWYAYSIHFSFKLYLSTST